MHVDSLNRWLNLLANVAVFASIMFLAVEIRQNQTAIEEANRLNLLEARTLEIEQFNQWRVLLIENPTLAKTWETGMRGEPLTAEEEFIFLNLCSNIIWISAGSFERSRALERHEAASATTSIRANMIEASPAFKSCWDVVASNLRNYGLGDYVSAVESQLSAQ